MKHKDFEDYLQDKFIRENPSVLDDDVPDAFSEWLADADVSDVIRWADAYARHCFSEGMLSGQRTTVQAIDMVQSALFK